MSNRNGRPREPIDITGNRYGKLVVKRFVGKNPANGAAMWECQCDCGNTKVIQYSALHTGRVRSCGCLRHDFHEPNEDLTGRQFGRLTVLRFAGRTKEWYNQLWECQCVCGNIVTITKRALVSGITVSCGCYQRERIAEIGRTVNAKPIHTKYGDFITSDFIIKEYRYMVTRVLTKEYYIRKHITIDKRWYDPDRVKLGDGIYRDEEGMKNFIEDMYPSSLTHVAKYGEHNTTLDRICGKKGYSVNNCRWATYTVQGTNKEDNRHIYDGEEILTFAECSRKYINPTVYLSDTERKQVSAIVQSRIKRGWTPNEVLACLKHAKIERRLVSRKEVRERYLIRKIDQSIVYDTYPDEPRMVGYEDYVPKPPTE